MYHKHKKRNKTKNNFQGEYLYLAQIYLSSFILHIFNSSQMQWIKMVHFPILIPFCNTYPISFLWLYFMKV